MQRILNEYTKPSHCDKRALHDGLAPLMALVAGVQKQVIEYRAALDAEMLTDDSDAAKLEHMHQTLGAIDREVAVFATAGRNLARTFTQWDRYLADAKANTL